jgi:hypothetical protein
MRASEFLIESAPITKKQELESRWNDPQFLAIHEPKWDNYRCDAVARSILAIEPNSVIAGFSDDDNPGTKYFDGHDDDGHAFVIVDNRYIVDPWMYEPENRSVWDLHDPKDAPDIKMLYGNPKNWGLDLNG